MSTLRLLRKSTQAITSSGIKVYLDDEHLCDMWDNDIKEFEIQHGLHILKVRPFMSGSSTELELNVDENTERWIEINPQNASYSKNTIYAFFFFSVVFVKVVTEWVLELENTTQLIIFSCIILILAYLFSPLNKKTLKLILLK